MHPIGKPPPRVAADSLGIEAGTMRHLDRLRGTIHSNGQRVIAHHADRGGRRRGR